MPSSRYRYEDLVLRLRLRLYLPPKIQSPSEPQNTPRNTPQIPVQNRNTEKYRKNIRKSPSFAHFLYLFSVSVLEGSLGCIRGVFWGSEGFCIFVWGTYDHKAKVRGRFANHAFSLLVRSSSSREMHAANKLVS